MRQLKNFELNSLSVAGGKIIYPTLYPGERLVGWEETFLYYEEQTVIEYGLFKDTVYITQVPIYQITPIVVSYY